MASGLTSRRSRQLARGGSGWGGGRGHLWEQIEARLQRAVRRQLPSRGCGGDTERRKWSPTGGGGTSSERGPVPGGSRADAAGRSRARGAEDRGPGRLVRRKRGLGGVTVRAPASRAGGGHRAGGRGCAAACVLQASAPHGNVNVEKIVSLTWPSVWVATFHSARYSSR